MIRFGVRVVAMLALAWARAGPAHAFSPDAIPEAVWWRVHVAGALRDDPLVAMREPVTFEASSEWAPLYRAANGARFERSSSSLRAFTPLGRVRAAVELSSTSTLARGGGGPWWIGTERSGDLDGGAAMAAFWRRVEVAGAVGVSHRRSGFAASARAVLAPGVSTTLLWSRWPQASESTVRWDDTHVLASGRWIDERLKSSVEYNGRRVRASLTNASLMRRSAASEPGDRLDPTLDWHASTLAVSTLVPGARVAASLAASDGHESLRIWRGGAPYWRMGGPVRQRLAEVWIDPVRSRVGLHAWLGRWSSEARGDLALWPFDVLATVLGSRRGVQGSASLTHMGVALDRRSADPAVFEGGVALWRLRPSAEYRSWQATLLGLGRTDESAGSASLREAILLGARLALTGRSGSVRIRLEAVQWAPVRVTETRTDGPPSEPGSGDSGAEAGARGPASGGTVLRLSISGLL